MDNHPLIDGAAEGIVWSETRSLLVALTPTRADLVRHTVQAGLRLALVSDERSRLTEPLRSALVGTGGKWIVRGPSGLRDGLTGRAVASIAAAFDDTPGHHAGSTDALRVERPLQTQLVVSLSLRHRADVSTSLGSAVAAFAALSGAPPAGWSPHEPVDRPWDQAALTAFARERMPADTRLIVAGSVEHPLSGILTARRTSHGVEEIDELLLGVGPPGEPAADAAVAAVPDVLATLAEAGPVLPLFGFVGVRPGAVDLSSGPFLAPGVRPLALLLGATAVRDLKLDAAALSARFDARAVGRPRTPSLLVTFPETHGWRTLLQLVDELGRDTVRQLVGLNFDEPRWQRLRDV